MIDCDICGKKLPTIKMSILSYVSTHSIKNSETLIYCLDIECRRSAKKIIDSIESTDFSEKYILF
jgi:hypothetical protein